MPIHVECKYVRTVPSYSDRRGARKKCVNRRLECEIWPLLLATSSHPQTNLCTGPNQTFRRYSRRALLDHVWQLRLISEQIMVFAVFLYERTFIGMGVEKLTNQGLYRIDLEHVRANAIRMYGYFLPTRARKMQRICTVPS